MAQGPKDPVASIRGRLQHRARQQGINPGRFLTAYYQEGLVARVTTSPYRDNFVLKGGLSLYGRYGFIARPTVDVDLGARNIPNDPERAREVFAEILATDAGDHLEFDTADIEARTIIEDAAYPGVRLELPVRLGLARDVLQLDLSFGNVITPAPVVLAFPAVLEEGRTYPILGYPLETLVAEKLAAASELGLASTRQKDFFDLLVVARSEPLEAATLLEAVQRTFRTRGTALERSRTVFAPAFAADPEMRRLWSRFLARQPLDAPPDFGAAMAPVRAMLEPLVEGRAGGRWQPEAGRWSDEAAGTEGA